MCNPRISFHKCAAIRAQSMDTKSSPILICLLTQFQLIPMIPSMFECVALALFCSLLLCLVLLCCRDRWVAAVCFALHRAHLLRFVLLRICYVFSFPEQVSDPRVPPARRKPGWRFTAGSKSTKFILQHFCNMNFKPVLLKSYSVLLNYSHGMNNRRNYIVRSTMQCHTVV